MVDDDVDRELVAAGQRGDVVPGAQPCVDLRMVLGVEASVRSVEGPKERQDVDPTEQAV